MRVDEKSLISIVVAVYNVKDYLWDCVSSIFSQTYSNIEIILVDDGSTDGSSDICDFARGQDSRVRVVHKQNGGLSDARNAGLSVSRGDYVTFVDGDDIVSKRLVEGLFTPISEGRADFSICSFIEGANPGQYLTSEPDLQDEELYQAEDAAAECLVGSKLTVSACGKLGRRSLWVQHLFPEGRVYEDLSTIPRLICDTNVVAFVQEPLYGQVMRAGSITRSDNISNKQYRDYYQAIQCNQAYFANRKSKKLHLAFMTREMIEYSRMIRLYSHINCPDDESIRILGEAKSIVKSMLFKRPYFVAPLKARVSAVLGLSCPALQSWLYDALQMYKRIRFKQG